MENIEKNQAINILVPRLIDKTEHLQNEIKTRILLNKIFSEFENKASNKLNYFITNSFKRYNCTKLGNNINTFLTEREKENKNEINKILNSNFYNDTDLKLEKKKMKYKSTTKLLKGINEIFDKIKYPLETRFSRNSKIKIREIINGKDELKSKKENKAKKVEIKKLTPAKRNIIKFYNKQSLTTDKKIINSELYKEQKSIQDSINDYLNKINNKILKAEENSGISPFSILNSETYRTKPKINFPKINFLEYRNIKRPKETKLNKNTFQKSPDINKIMPYYKSFKKREDEKINNEDKKIPFITEVGIKVQNNNKDREYDFDDTQDVVYTSANNELNIHQSLDFKRKKLDEMFGLNNVPNITTYNNIISKKIVDSRMEKFKKIKSTNNIMISTKQKFNDIINNEMKKLDILEEQFFSKSRKNYKKY
jgi:hypothetical protein